MPTGPNELRWDGQPGHYEVYYVSLTDAASGCGAWVRYTLTAPLPGSVVQPNASLWFMAFDPAGGPIARKRKFPLEELHAESSPFSLGIGGATLTDGGMSGAFDDVSWDLRWTPAGHPHEHVHPFLQAARIAKTILLLPHADVAIEGSLSFPGHELSLDGARGGQAHLWGSKHATRWAWAHCSDFQDVDGDPRPDTFVDGVSVFVPRLGREIGPSSPVVGRFFGQDFASTSPLVVTRNPSRFDLTSWHFEARDGSRRIIGTVEARREDLVGVTYQDPDGQPAYCYNSEVASMNLQVWDRHGRGASGWKLRDTLVSDGRAHFEYAQREPAPGVELHLAA
ncbi:MAG: hypothetical protein QOI98_1513 [Solirubrobacteraceae bacterium]|nr:hypothetical protein [Solirubrobacteraceae bacterium]